MQTYNATFNGGAAQTTFYPGANVFVRAQVSDPFGSFDISSARITIIDPANVTQVNNVADDGAGRAGDVQLARAAATCIFQYQYAVPASPALGGWTVRVTANEGTEGTVTDLGVGNFTVAIPQPTITMVKTSTVLSDPVNNTTNPKRIPLAVVRYDITRDQQRARHGGRGHAGDHRSDPGRTRRCTSRRRRAIPVVFINGATASGLTYNYATQRDVFVDGRERAVDLHARAGCRMDSIRRCAPCASRPRAS